MSILEEIETTIREVLPSAKIYVRDPYEDGQHLNATVVAEEFESFSLFKQHQVIMKALKGHFEKSLHALQLKTYSPSQWKEQQEKEAS